jgi:hypothetical protein
MGKITSVMHPNVTALYNVVAQTSTDHFMSWVQSDETTKLSIEPYLFANLTTSKAVWKDLEIVDDNFDAQTPVEYLNGVDITQAATVVQKRLLGKI